MHLTVLGCSGSVPGPNAPASGYLVEAGGATLALDLGNGTLAALQAAGHDPFDLDAVLFSHLHPDHCADFTALTVLRRYHPAPPRDPEVYRLPVYGPVEAPSRFAAAYAPDAKERAETDLSDVYRFQGYPPEPVRIAECTIRTRRVAHLCEAYGMRIEYQGRSLCYTGDTGPCEALMELAAGVDVLLAEASWTHAPNRPDALHMSGTQAGELAAQAGVGKLLVTHVQPWMDRAEVLAEARAVFDGAAALAEPGARYSIG